MLTRVHFFRPIKLDYYILSEILLPCFGGVLFFSFVFLMSQALRLAELFINRGVEFNILAQLASLMLIYTLPMALPLALLIGVLVGFGRLSADSELVAMKANGISIFQLSTPVILLGLFTMFISFGLNLEWAPWAERTFNKTLVRVGNTHPVASIKEGTFTSGFFDLLIFADKVDVGSNRLQRVFLYDERESKNPLTVVAKEGEVVSLKKEPPAIILKLSHGNIHHNDLLRNMYQKINFENYQLYLKINKGSDDTVISPKMISFKELFGIVRKIPFGSKENLAHSVEFWRRISLAITPLIFVFLGIGFGTIKTRTVRAGAALIALAVVVVYWGLLTTCITLVFKGFVLPVIALQVPNLIASVVAFYSFRSAAW